MGHHNLWLWPETLIVLPVPAITEVAYLLARDIGNDATADFISSLAD